MVLMKSPDEHQKNLSDITKVNTHSSSFDFLKDEPDIYTRADVKSTMKTNTETTIITKS